jgi:hypothetical protein
MAAARQKLYPPMIQSQFTDISIWFHDIKRRPVLHRNDKEYAERWEHMAVIAKLVRKMAGHKFQMNDQHIVPASSKIETL